MVISFLYSLAGGTLVVLATGRTDEIAWKYLRLVGTLVFVLMAGVVTWLVAWGGFDRSSAGVVPGWLGTAAGVGSAAVITMAPVARSIPRAFRAVCALGGLAGLAAGAMSTVLSHDFEPANSWAAGMVVVSQVAGGMLLGSITAAWILGHAYLTATKMTIHPLRHFCRLTLGCVTLRGVFLLVSVLMALLVGGNTSPTVLDSLGSSWLILSLRIGSGLLGVGVLSLLILDCVRLRSTQSATGLLYFGSILAYIGELASQELIRECGWPL